MQFHVVEVRTLAQLQDALSVRRAVFIEEQGVSEEEEIDGYDAGPASHATAHHVIAYLEGRPVATGRLLLDTPAGENAHIGRVAVLGGCRGAGFGRAVMLALQDEARRRGYPGITLASQVRAIGFYEALGYKARGEIFFDAGIEHRWMDLQF